MNEPRDYAEHSYDDVVPDSDIDGDGNLGIDNIIEGLENFGGENEDPTPEEDALLDGNLSEESAIPVLDENDEKERLLSTD